MNSVFDEKDNFISAKIQTTIDHRYMDVILDFDLEYTNGDTWWHHITVVKDKDPHTTDNYVISNDMGPISNGIHGHWACKFLRSLKLTLHRLRRCEFNSFDGTMYNPSPGKKWRSCRYQNNNKTKSGPIKVTALTHKRTFKFGFEVPKS